MSDSEQPPAGIGNRLNVEYGDSLADIQVLSFDPGDNMDDWAWGTNPDTGVRGLVRLRVIAATSHRKKKPTHSLKHVSTYRDMWLQAEARRAAYAVEIDNLDAIHAGEMRYIAELKRETTELESENAELANQIQTLMQSSVRTR